MPRTPSSYPDFAMPCDRRLPQQALQYRLRHSPPLTSGKFLGAINVTAWLYVDKTGKRDVQVNPNTTIKELMRKFGPAETPDAEVGFHSEMNAAEWFRRKPYLQVLQIFSERIPCREMCGPMLKAYFPGVPWYYYYNARSWKDERGKIFKYAGEVLKSAYEL
ncbi:MAG TPA: hypothetical protein VH639_25160 [Bryobacteraceae bacterium]|jgi:hypothetical protein